MRPEDLVTDLKAAIGSDLTSVVLYGSAAAGDFTEKRSDYNILVVTARLGVADLKALSGPASRWSRVGNPPPLLFTLDRLKKSCDVFPIELLDIQDSHRILYGEDIISKLVVSKENLRLQVEHELKGKLIQLRENFLLTGGKPKRVIEVLIQSLSPMLVLVRAGLRLFQDQVPKKKMDALEAFSSRAGLETKVFHTIEELKMGTLKPRGLDVDQVFSDYLKATEQIVDAIDDYVHS